MACFGTDGSTPDGIIGVCPSCGSEVNSDGFAIDSCAYSPQVCDTCDSRPCDGSC